MADDKQILLSSQIDPNVDDDPAAEGIYETGVLANVLQLLKLPDGTVKVLVEGKARVRITEYLDNESFFEAHAEPLSETEGDSATVEALTRSVAEEFERYAKVKKNIPEEALSAIAESRDADQVWLTLSPAIWVSRSTRSRRFWRRSSVAERLEKVLWPDAGRNVGPAGRERRSRPA